MNDAEHNHERSGADEPWLEGRDAAVATEVLAASLEPAELPADGWDRLRAALPVGDTDGPRAAVATEVPVPGRAGRRPTSFAQGNGKPARPHWPAYAWAAAAAVVLVVSGVGVWGVRQASEAASLRDDQRILAYWMGNPDMTLTALQPTGEGGDTRLGVLCVLPDGRALVLQPNPAGRGQTYVVVGRGPSGATELARGHANMLQFDVTGFDVVELRLVAGDASTTLARATLD